MAMIPGLRALFWLYLACQLRNKVKKQLLTKLLHCVSSQFSKMAVIPYQVIADRLSEIGLVNLIGVNTIFIVNLGLDFYMWCKLKDTPKTFLVISSRSRFSQECGVVSVLFEENYKIKSFVNQGKKLTIKPSYVPPIADECRIAPVGIKTTCHESVLENFFSYGLAVSSGDFIVIETVDRKKCVNFHDDAETFIFKVIELKSSITNNETFLVSKLTRLYVMPAIYEPKPRRDKIFSYCESTADYREKDVVPYGMAKSFASLHSLVNHYFTNRQNITSLPCIILEGQIRSGKYLIAKCLAEKLGLFFECVNMFEAVSDKSGSSEAVIDRLFASIGKVGPTVLYLQNIAEFGKNRESGSVDLRVVEKLLQAINTLNQEAERQVLLIAGIEASKKVLPEISRLFRHKIVLTSGSEERLGNLRWICEEQGIYVDEDVVRKVAEITSGFVFGDLQTALTIAIRDMPKSRSPDKKPMKIGLQEFIDAVEKVRSWQSEASGFPKIPSVNWDDIGGLENVRKQIIDMISFTTKIPHLAAVGIRQCGLLMWGPPGTGKTLVAKAVATELSLNFLSVKGPELLNMYVGQSEENVREIFRRAREARPCLVFFDELDSLAPNRGRSGDSGGVMDRVVSQLLAELDSLSTINDVFLLGATNRPDMIDPSLLRPGRFDKKVYLGLSKDVQSKVKVLQALTRKFSLDIGLNWLEIAEKLPENTSGADLYALVTDALLVAVNGRIGKIQTDLANEFDPLVLSTPDFMEAVSRLKPSVSLSELKMYESVFSKHQ